MGRKISWNDEWFKKVDLARVEETYKADKSKLPLAVKHWKELNPEKPKGNYKKATQELKDKRSDESEHVTLKDNGEIPNQ